MIDLSGGDEFALCALPAVLAAVPALPMGTYFGWEVGAAAWILGIGTIFYWMTHRGVHGGTGDEGALGSGIEAGVRIGDEGRVLSDLHPVGMASIHGRRCEVHSSTGIIERGSVIRVMTIKDARIFVMEAKVPDGQVEVRDVVSDAGVHA